MIEYIPIGSIVEDGVYSAIDKKLDALGIEHDETVAEMIVAAICSDGIEICIKVGT